MLVPDRETAGRGTLHGWRTGIRPAVLTIGAIALSAACGPAEAQGPAAAAPAHVEPAAEQGGAAQITLTPEAVARLGIETVVIERRAVPATRTYAAEVVVAAGRALSLTAPLPGVLRAAGDRFPRPGDRVSAADPLVQLLPTTSPDRDLTRLEAEALARVTATRSQAQRAEQLLRDGAGSQRELEQAQAEFAVAEAMLEGVRAQRAQLNQTGEGREGGLAIVAPMDGVLSAVTAGAGQSVEQGRVLVEMFDDDPLWLRIPIYVGDLASIDRTAAIPIGTTGRTARPVAAPPTANATAATLDLYYAARNADRVLVPGQRIEVALPLGTSDDGAPRLTVDRAALIYDASGNAWVYANPSPATYVRRRVEVDRVAGELAVLLRGPEPGTVVVTAGAAELYGTEFGVGH